MESNVALARVIQGELPFTLNLPDGTYPALVAGEQTPIDILQNWLAVADGPDGMRVGTEQSLREYFGDRWPSLYKHDLRTVVRRRELADVPRASLPVPTDEQLFEAAQEHLMRRHTPGIVPGGAQQLQLQARQWLDGLAPVDRLAFTGDTGARLAAAAAFPHRGVDTFCSAVNVLIRLYMATFRDRFVQEINQSMFSGTAFRGLHSGVFCEGAQLDHCRYAGGFAPYIIRRPWQEHPAQAVSDFCSRLGADPQPDPVVLLQVRAQSLLLRGAYRSAMIEASAAFDLCLKRKITAGLRAKGKSDHEIDQILEHKRLEERAKAILKEATGKSIPELDNALWGKFLKDRKQRGSVAHSHTEPAEGEATSAVEDMMKLADMVDKLPT